MMMFTLFIRSGSGNPAGARRGAERRGRWRVRHHVLRSGPGTRRPLLDQVVQGQRRVLPGKHQISQQFNCLSK